MLVTRFRPTAGNGPLHVGHLLNAYANLLHAHKCGGEFLVIADVAPLFDMLKFPDDRSLGEYRRNVALLEALFPRKKIVCALMDEWLVLKFLEHKLGEPVHKIYDPMLLMAAYDFLMGVTHLVRGRDWDPQSRFVARPTSGPGSCATTSPTWRGATDSDGALALKPRPHHREEKILPIPNFSVAFGRRVAYLDVRSDGRDGSTPRG